MLVEQFVFPPFKPFKFSNPNLICITPFSVYVHKAIDECILLSLLDR